MSASKSFTLSLFAVNGMFLVVCSTSTNTVIIRKSVRIISLITWSWWYFHKPNQSYPCTHHVWWAWRIKLPFDTLLISSLSSYFDSNLDVPNLIFNCLVTWYSLVFITLGLDTFHQLILSFHLISSDNPCHFVANQIRYLLV